MKYPKFIEGEYIMKNRVFVTLKRIAVVIFVVILPICWCAFSIYAISNMEPGWEPSSFWELYPYLCMALSTSLTVILWNSFLFRKENTKKAEEEENNVNSAE